MRNLPRRQHRTEYYNDDETIRSDDDLQYDHVDSYSFGGRGIGEVFGTGLLYDGSFGGGAATFQML